MSSYISVLVCAPSNWAVHDPFVGKANSSQTWRYLRKLKGPLCFSTHVEERVETAQIATIVPSAKMTAILSRRMQFPPLGTSVLRSLVNQNRGEESHHDLTISGKASAYRTGEWLSRKQISWAVRLLWGRNSLDFFSRDADMLTGSQVI